MLRITLHDELDRVTLKLEGNLVRIWVSELETAWRSAASGLAGRSLHLDMRAVDHVDQAGVFLLALLRQRGVQLTVSGTVSSTTGSPDRNGGPQRASRRGRSPLLASSSLLGCNPNYGLWAPTFPST
jgi:ABC-type transporter Mla MlaB component